MAIYDPKEIEKIVDYRVQQEIQKFFDQRYKGWEVEFDKTFRDRMWQIVKKAFPLSYNLAKEFDLFDKGGPQIYGEIKSFISNLLKYEQQK